MALVDAVPFVVANWPLNEASGNALDAVGSNTLADNNGVGSAAGKLYPLARQFDGTQNHLLRRASNSDLQAGSGDWMIRAWVYLEDDPPANGAIIFYKAAAGAFEYGLAINASRRPMVAIAPSGSPGSPVILASGTALDLNTWYLVHAWHDATNDLIGISVNAGTATTQAHTTGTHNDTFDVQAGKRTNQDLQNLTGRIQDLVWMKGRFLTAAERTEDYNSGNGIAFLDWDGDNSSSSSPSSASSESSSSTSSDSSQSSESSSDSSESSSASSESSSASSESSSASSESSSASSGSSSDSSESSSASSESSSDSSQSSSSSQSDSSSESSQSSESSSESSSQSQMIGPYQHFISRFWGDWW